MDVHQLGIVPQRFELGLRRLGELHRSLEAAHQRGTGGIGPRDERPAESHRSVKERRLRVQGVRRTSKGRRPPGGTRAAANRRSAAILFEATLDNAGSLAFWLRCFTLRHTATAYLGISSGSSAFRSFTNLLNRRSQR
jgi:hypothetical protein